MNTDGAQGARDAMMAAGQAGPDEDEGAVDPFARQAALGAHDRLDGHAADIAALKDWTGMPEPDAGEAPGQPGTADAGG